MPQDPEQLSPFVAGCADPPRQAWQAWRDAWWESSQALTSERQATIAPTLRRWTLPEPPVRSCIERIWADIDEHDNWQPLHDWLDRCGSSHSAGSGCSALQLPRLDSV
ncbi:protein adenylyltransferase SelO family protein [Synechococcus sp. CS-205]|uniref:protein adenylyltransferase SelO family protein n=1 Tax=Synechococcus sp. CS-205 TaxID=2847984 RepID=UPI0028805912|nr:protein adenylyltransferase SelO family protein [Synechococcus sp. CS-205]